MYVTPENCSSVISQESLTPNGTEFHFMDVSHIQRTILLTTNICKPLSLTPYEQKANIGLRSRKKGVEKRTFSCEVKEVWSNISTFT